LELKINEERGFLMKNKEQIEDVLMAEHALLKKEIDDPNTPMTEIEWANQSGWIEALEWVIGNIKVGEDFIPEEQINA